MSDIKSLHIQAESGDISAQYLLGECYYNGTGVSKDPRIAVKWWLSAAEQGHVRAQSTLGKCYLTGTGILKDHVQATTWLRRAAEQNHTEAQAILGKCYENGVGVLKDLAQAVKWYRRAANQGHLEAQGALLRLGESLINTTFVSISKPPNEKKDRIEKLQGQLRERDAKIKELTARLQECMTYANAAKERLAQLSKFEDLRKAMALEAELGRLRVQEREYRAKINEHITSANLRAQRILNEANKKAEEIAGDAVKVARDFRQYERAAQAIRNIIEGYGNRYIIPGRSLLDELADVYGHTEAGKELKRAREHVKQMVIDGTAAQCDYVETNRSETAVTFVTDAFNGKVDSILSRVKRDNYGTLKQEIQDAFTVVNMNGRAFRNARITDQYLNARVDELKWASAAQEVRNQDQEEQRRIKERMREEEKARREYERAIKEAEKEESYLKKAMETAQRQLAEATEIQKSKFEGQIAELRKRLDAAEEKNKRALSMAQQTRYGYVYIISNIGSFGEGVYKIGMTRRLDPMDRVRELGDASVPFNFDVHAMIEHDDAPALESMLHKHFVLNRINKVNHRREFFRATAEEIKQQVDAFGLNVHWTMAAEARQYYETLAIEKAISENPEMRNAWINNELSLEAEEMEQTIFDENTEGTEMSEN